MVDSIETKESTEDMELHGIILRFDARRRICKCVVAQNRRVSASPPLRVAGFRTFREILESG
jgi:hypothetical protein